MKFAHISDIHLGYSSGKKVDKDTKINIREQDGYYALEECLKDIIIHKDELDFVLCTGDFFHSPTPSIRTATRGLSLLRLLVDAKIPFYCLAGNHDATDVIKDVPSNAILHIPEINLFSYTEPYKIVQIPNSKVCLHLVSHHGYTAQLDTMKDVKPIDDMINILCSHGSCYDEFVEAILSCEGEPREIVIPESVLKLDWDYVLLGHIHTRGWVGSSDGLTDTLGNKVFYGGSLFRRGFSDSECPLGRGWTLWTINEDTHEMTPEFFQITQRLQIDKVIDCEDKTILEIEDTLENFFKGVDIELQPIVRVTLANVSKTIKQQINWARYEEITKHFLTFIIKVLTKEEMKKRVTGEVFSFDILTAYKDYWKEVKQNYDKQIQSDIGKTSTQLLREGQDKVLELKNK